MCPCNCPRGGEGGRRGGGGGGREGGREGGGGDPLRKLTTCQKVVGAHKVEKFTPDLK